MHCSIWPAVERGRQYAFPAVWAAVFATGVGLSEPLPSFDAAPYLSFAPIGSANARTADQPVMPALDAEPQALTFVHLEPTEPDDIFHLSSREPSIGHGRFAAPANAVRRQIQLRPTTMRLSPRSRNSSIPVSGRRLPRTAAISCSRISVTAWSTCTCRARARAARVRLPRSRWASKIF